MKFIICGVPRYPVSTPSGLSFLVFSVLSSVSGDGLESLGSNCKVRKLLIETVTDKRFLKHCAQNDLIELVRSASNMPKKKYNDKKVKRHTDHSEYK